MSGGARDVRVVCVCVCADLSVCLSVCLYVHALCVAVKMADVKFFVLFRQTNHHW